PRLKTVTIEPIEPVAEPVRETAKLAAVPIPETVEMPAIESAAEPVEVEHAHEHAHETVKMGTVPEEIAALGVAAATEESGFELVAEPAANIQEDVVESKAVEPPPDLVFDLDAGAPIPSSAAPSPIEESLSASSSEPLEISERPIAEMTGEFTFE